MLSAPPKSAGIILPYDKYNSTNFHTLWDFEGVLKYSPLFYGWYTNRDPEIGGYRLPFAYFLTGLLVYAYSFFATLRKMAENSRMSKLSEKDDECTFSWKVFTGWDYMIGNAETAHNRVASIVVGFKEALVEEAEKKRQSRNWKETACRIIVNTLVLGLLVLSACAVVMVVQRGTEPEASSTFWRSNETPIVLTLISIIFPMIFDVLGILEKYHPRKHLRLQLARIMVLNLLNLYSLIFALFVKIDTMTGELEVFKNTTKLNTELLVPSEMPQISLNMCIEACQAPQKPNALQVANLIAVLANISVTALPTIMQYQNSTLSSHNTNTEFYNFNTTDEIFNTTTNFTFSNSTVESVEQFEAIDLYQNSFIDYLSFILSKFEENGTLYNNSLANVTITSTIDYETFKSTISPFINTSSSEEETNNFISTIFDELTSTNPSIDCSLCDQSVSESSTQIASTLNYTTQTRLGTLCWETMFGQELMKLTVMDTVMTIISTLGMDFFRGLFVRFMNRCWCWDLEKKFPKYADFKVAENILHLVNNQGMVWMGMFFSPGLVVVNVIKLLVMMYFRGWIVLTCNVPHSIIFRASRSNNFYYALLLMMLFLCVLPVGYAIVWIKPSWHCGPFRDYHRIFHIFTKTIKKSVPNVIVKVLDYIASPGIVIPLLVLLILIIYYLVSLTGALRESNDDLKFQLKRERTEERRKMFQMADRQRRAGTSSDFCAQNPFNKWKKILEPSLGKSFEDATTPKQDSSEVQEKEVKKDFLQKFFRKSAKGKSSVSDEDQETDTDQHDSLPEDPAIRAHQSLKNSISGDSADLPKRQDSIRSELIPVITITSSKAEGGDEGQTPLVKFKPKVKYALTKQSSEIDENAICLFGREVPPLAHIDDEMDAVSRKSETESSEDTVGDCSNETVLNFPRKNATFEGIEQDIGERSPIESESSSGYNDPSSSL